MFENRLGANVDFLNLHSDLNSVAFSHSAVLSDIITPRINNFSVMGAVSPTLSVVPLSKITIVASDKGASETTVGLTPNLGTFTLTRTNDITSVLSVNYSVAGTATNGQDYDSLTGVAIFNAGSSTAVINVKPIDDSLYE
jgi:hypothetical protein